MAVWDGGDKAMEACDSFEVRGRMGEWTSKLNMGPYGCGLWRSIRTNGMVFIDIFDMRWEWGIGCCFFLDC